MHKILGLDDSVTTCDCCGKSGLKFTVAVELAGEVLHYGSTCATRHTKMTKPQITAAIANERAERVEAARAEYRKAPERLAYEVRLATAYRSKVAPGRTFMEYVRETSDAATVVARAIAAAHRVETYEVMN